MPPTLFYELTQVSQLELIIFYLHCLKLHLQKIEKEQKIQGMNIEICVSIVILRSQAGAWEREYVFLGTITYVPFTNPLGR